MLTTRLYQVIRTISAGTRRNFGASTIALQKADPIQQLFVDKIRDYKKQGKVEMTPDVKLEYESEMKRLERIYTETPNEDMLNLPDYQFSDTKLGPYDLGQQETKISKA